MIGLVFLGLLGFFVHSAAAQTFACNGTLAPATVAYWYAICAADVGTPADPGCATVSNIANGATLVQFNSLLMAATLPFSLSFTQSPALAFVCNRTVEESSVLIAQYVLRSALNINPCGFGKIRDLTTGECQNENGAGDSNTSDDIQIGLLIAILVTIVVGIIIRGTFIADWLKKVFTGEVKISMK